MRPKLLHRHVHIVAARYKFVDENEQASRIKTTESLQKIAKRKLLT